MSPEQYQQLAAQDYNRIPISKAVIADLDTPLSIYLKLAAGPYSYLFESIQGGEKWGRHSIIGLPAKVTIRVTGHSIRMESRGEILEECHHPDPLAWIDDYIKQFKVPEIDALPMFNGGLVGYFGYDCVRLIEPKLGKCQHPDAVEHPDITLMISDEVIVFDNLRGKFHIVVHADPKQANAYEDAQTRIDEIESRLNHPGFPTEMLLGASQGKPPTQFTSNIEFPEYQDKIQRIIQYLIEGDAMQIVFSRHLSGDFDAPPINLYRALRCLNPSPYLFYLNLDDHYVVGSSPEILVRLEDQEINLRPIAGTRPRGKTAQEDRELEAELLSDPKELAEHLMLIDLGRNDVGRVAETGSVQLTDKMVIERYSHVMHIVSNVSGKLAQEMSAIDVFKATFPAGTLSGAPKVRAMEIIDELETVKRGLYGGAVGYIAWNGNMDLAIAIRTALIKDNQIHLQAGGGIVVDSTAEQEWQETVNKSNALVRAVRMVENGLNTEVAYDPHA